MKTLFIAIDPPGKIISIETEEKITIADIKALAYEKIQQEPMLRDLYQNKDKLIIEVDGKNKEAQEELDSETLSSCFILVSNKDHQTGPALPDFKLNEEIRWELRHFSENCYTKITIEYNGKNIQDVHYKITEESTWTQYDQDCKNFHSANTSHHKVHIAVQHDKENIKKVINLVKPILLINGIQLFKYVNVDDAQAMQRSDNNLNGKEMVINMQLAQDYAQEGNIEFWRTLFRFLERKLVAAKIVPHEIGASGDMRLAGSQYFYWRESHNIGNRYVQVDFLKECGFTRVEAAHLKGLEKPPLFPIAENKFFPQSSKRRQKHSRKKAKLISAEKINKHIEKCLLGSADEPHDGSPLFKIIFGTESRDYIVDIALNCINKLFKIPRDFRNEKYYATIRCATTEPIKFLRPYLNEAIKQLRKVLVLLNLDGAQLGNPVPALYHHFFIPLVNYLKANKSNYGYHSDKSNEIMEQLPIIINVRELISQIVLCCLRDPSIEAIRFDKPQYKNQLSEQQIREALSQPEPQFQATSMDKRHYLFSFFAGALLFIGFAAIFTTSLGLLAMLGAVGGCVGLMATWIYETCMNRRAAAQVVTQVSAPPSSTSTGEIHRHIPYPQPANSPQPVSTAHSADSRWSLWNCCRRKSNAQQSNVHVLPRMSQ